MDVALTRFRPVIIGLLLLALFGPGSLVAQVQPTERPFERQLEIWNLALDEAKLTVGRPGVTGAELDNASKNLRRVRDEALEVKAKAAKQADSELQLLKALGAPPAEGEPPEDKKVAEQRQQLTEKVGFYEGRAKQAELIVAQAEETLEAVGAKRVSRRADKLLEERRSPLSPGALEAAWSELGGTAGKILGAPVAWWQSGQLQAHWRVALLTVAAALAGFFVVGWPLRHWLLRRFGRDPAIAVPSYSRRLLAAVAEGVAEGLFPALVALAVLVVISRGDVVSGLFAELLIALLTAVIFLILAFGLSDAALSPHHGNWRPWPLTDAAAVMLIRRLRLLAVVAAIALFRGMVAEAIAPGVALHDLGNFVNNTIIAVLMLMLLQRRLWETTQAAPAPVDEGREDRARLGWWWSSIRLLAGILALAVPIAGGMGYAELSSRLTDALVMGGLLLVGFVIGRVLIQESAAVLLQRDLGPAAYIRRALGLSEGATKTLQFWLTMLAELALAIAFLALGLRLLGVSGEGAVLWMERLARGIKVGEYTISPADIVLAFLVFGLLFAATRTVQWFLGERLLPQTRLDRGVRDSIRAGVGYVGVTIAVFAAIGTLGLDFYNLAIVAGALSVGIGFGLQNVVNNFVSGLILLIERPIKVGDWVAVGEHQGYIKRINVRATEIETFQKASVIVPNSQLIASPVLNWTHKDTSGRVEVPVGVAYGTDPELVRGLLLEAARNHSLVRKWPEPYVIFMDFGSSSLDFELRCFIGQVDYRLSVASDLRFAIDKAFREHGVEIPFPQRDLHLKDVDRLERLFAAALGAGERKGGGASGNGNAEHERGEHRHNVQRGDRAEPEPAGDHLGHQVPKLAGEKGQG
jgi:small-conductance mechanosensitive channel